MSTVSYIKEELNELKKMPFFYGRLICFSILFALDELTVTHFESPYLYYFIIALALFFIPSVVMQALALDRVGAKLKMSAPLFWWLVLGGIAIVNEVAYGLLHSVTPIYLASVFCFFIPVLALCGKEKGFYKLFLLSLAGPMLFNIISGLVLFPIESNIYALGVAGFFPVILFGTEWAARKRCFLASFLFVISAVISIVLLYFSLCRTGFTAALLAIPAFIAIVSFAKRADRRNIIYKETSLSAVSVILVLLLILLTVSLLIYFCSMPTLPWEDWIQEMPETMIEKFVYSIKNNNLFTSRSAIWKYTFDNASFIGNGPFFYMGDVGYWHAHNSFVAVLGHYGIIPFILYCFFFIWAFATSVKYCFNGKTMRFLPFITIFTYYVASMTEDLACVVVPRMFSVLFYFACAILINESAKVEKEIIP